LAWVLLASRPPKEQYTTITEMVLAAAMLPNEPDATVFEALHAALTARSNAQPHSLELRKALLSLPKSKWSRWASFLVVIVATNTVVAAGAWLIAALALD
jgi:hypothetical protein